MTGNPFAALSAQAVETGISDEDSENEVTDDISASQATPRAPKRTRAYIARTPKQKKATTDTIVVASDGEGFSSRLQRRLRKPSEKTKQNKADQEVFGTGKVEGRDGVDGLAVQEHIQDQMNEQTGILKILLKGLMKQEAYNKKMEAKLSHLEKELEAVKGECQAVCCKRRLLCRRFQQPSRLPWARVQEQHQHPCGPLRAAHHGYWRNDRNNLQIRLHLSSSCGRAVRDTAGTTDNVDLPIPCFLPARNSNDVVQGSQRP